MLSFVGLSADNDALGRVGSDSLSQQVLMELLVERIENKQTLMGGDDELNEFSQWSEVGTNSDADVISISWRYFGLIGEINIRWIPPTTESFDVGGNSLFGTLDFRFLPSIRKLLLDENEFRGSIQLCHLPEGIEHVDLATNTLNGSLDLENLPNSIETLYLSENRFSGEVCLKHLPTALKVLSLAVNELTGSVDLTNLPPNIEKLFLYKNLIKGRTDFSKLPESLKYLYLSKTYLSGDVYLTRDKFVTVYGSNVTLHTIEW